MSPSYVPEPTTSIDLQRLHDHSVAHSKQSTAPANADRLSPYSGDPYSNSGSPSSFTSPAELTSETGGYSDFTDFNGEDEFFGVDFDAGENIVDGDPNVSLSNVSLHTAEIPVEAYLPPLHSAPTQSSETLTTSAYPMTPTLSSSSNISHPRNESYDTQISSPQHQGGLSQGLTSATSQPYAHYNTHPSIGLQPTPDLSGSSHTSAEGIAPTSMGHIGHSPRVTVTAWGSQGQRDISVESDHPHPQFREHLAPAYQEKPEQVSYDYHMDDAPIEQSPSFSGADFLAQQEQQQDDDGQSGRNGLDPDSRKAIEGDELPNLKEQEEWAKLQIKNMEVEEWRSQGGDSSDTSEGPETSRSTLNTPDFNMRRRARSIGPMSTHSNSSNTVVRGFIDPNMIQPHTATKDPEEGRGIEPVDDQESIHENQLKEGQTYFDVKANGINEADREATLLSRHFYDAPMYPYAVNTKNQAPTAVEAMRRWNERADNYSMLSRTATWGTRRRSEPSIADIESINDGSFLKRLSISRGKEKRPEPGNYFKNSLDQLTNIVRKKSDGGKLKRNRSERETRGRHEAPRKESQSSLGQSSLAPPPRSPSGNRMRPASPRLDTTVGNAYGQGVAHVRNGSVSASVTTSPKNPLNSFIGSIRRARSKSDMSGRQQGSALVDLWNESGGPPVPTLAQQTHLPDPEPENSHIKAEHSDPDAEEDEDEEFMDDGEKMDLVQSSIPITPNLAGFQEHVKRLNPDMESTYLIDRIAHQLVVRYKALLQSRVKHQGALANGNCTSGLQCLSQGGMPKLFDSKGQPRDNNFSTAGDLDLSDGDSNPEGTLVLENFPPGVPMPPASTLPAEFECQLCFRVKKFQKPSDWTKHVHEDVQPFTCTYPSCREPKSFKRKADWVRHENERHRHLEWWTCEVEDCTHKCYRKDNFLQHLVREHKLPEPKAKTKAAVKRARGGPDEHVWIMVKRCHHETINKPQDEPCRFCGKTLTSWKKLTVHLAKHMEHISLPVLELVKLPSIDANTIISPVEPLPQRQTPLPVTPIDGRRLSDTSAHYGSLSAGISEGVPSIGQFQSHFDQTSPNIHTMHQFPNGVFREMTYNQPTSNNSIPFSTAPQSNHGIYDSSGLGFMGLDQISHNANLDAQSRAFGSMDHSPHIDQSHGFNPVTQGYTTPISQQGFHNSYPNSSHTLSPDPANFVSGPQQMPGFQGQALGPDSSFASGAHPMNSFTAHQNQVIGLDESQFSYQALSNSQEYNQTRMNMDQGNHGLYPSQQPQMVRSQNNTTYPPSSQGGYAYGQ